MKTVNLRFGEKNCIRFGEKNCAQRWICKKVPSFTFNTKRCPTKL